MTVTGLVTLDPVCPEGCCVATADPTLRLDQLRASNEVRPMFEVFEDDDEGDLWSGARWHPGLLEEDAEPEPRGWQPPAWVVELIGAYAGQVSVDAAAWAAPRPDEPATWRVVDYRHPSPRAVLTDVTDR